MTRAAIVGRRCGAALLLALGCADTRGQCPAVPVTAAQAVATTAGTGRELDLQHRRTSSKRLEIEWDYPAWPPLPKPGQPAPGAPRNLGGALRFLAGSDRRPLLVVRECRACVGSDAALLRGDASNEQTLLLTRWFHCVKLPPQVVRDDHPFRVLFPGPAPAHAFLALADGTSVTRFDGAQTQAQLWAVMFPLLRAVYRLDPEPRVKEWRQLLVEFDTLDALRGTIEDRIQTENERGGRDTPLARALAADLADVQRRMAEALLREARVRDLRFRDPPLRTAKR